MCAPVSLSRLDSAFPVLHSSQPSSANYPKSSLCALIAACLPRCLQPPARIVSDSQKLCVDGLVEEVKDFSLLLPPVS